MPPSPLAVAVRCHSPAPPFPNTTPGEGGGPASACHSLIPQIHFCFFGLGGRQVCDSWVKGSSGQSLNPVFAPPASVSLPHEMHRCSQARGSHDPISRDQPGPPV